jgi:hypothetical protein
MPTNPIITCKRCKIIVDSMINTANNIKKNIKLYVFFAIILIEFFSMYLQNNVAQEVYTYKLYPALVNIEFALIFLAIFLHSKALRFCFRQRLIILFLIIYFLFNCVTIFFPICWSEYILIVNYSILSIIFILFFATWRNL